MHGESRQQNVQRAAGQLIGRHPMKEGYDNKFTSIHASKVR